MRKVTAGVITTVAGTGAVGSTGDNGAATSATLYSPYGVAVGAGGNVYISEQGGNRLRMVTPGNIISLVAGTGTAGYSGDGQPANTATLKNPTDLSIDAGGTLYISDTGNNRIRKITLFIGTTTVLTSSLNPSSVGQSVTSRRR